MYDILVWGIGNGYKNLKKHIDSNKIKINALISNYSENIKSLDGLDVVRPDEFRKYKFDYIIIAEDKSFERIVKMVKHRGGKCIDAKLFELDKFDFEKYILSYEKNISMVKNDYSGGLLYYESGIMYNSDYSNRHEVLFLGTIAEYDNFVRFNSQINLKINAIISNIDENIKSIDNIDLIQLNEIQYYKFEYIIVSNNELFKSMVKKESEIQKQVFIPARVFQLKGFDFDKYISILNKNISIISNDCWGSYLCYSLGLRFNTPFITFLIPNPKEYIKLIKNVEHYLNLPLEIINDGKDVFEMIRGRLGEDITINFNHDYSVEEIKQKWERRVKRFNFDNYFVEMRIENDEDAIEFDKVNIKNKIGFYYKELNLNSVLCLQEWENIKFRGGRNCYLYGDFVRKTVMPNCDEFNRYFDILKFLNCEEDFKRNIEYK